MKTEETNMMQKKNKSFYSTPVELKEELIKDFQRTSKIDSISYLSFNYGGLKQLEKYLSEARSINKFHTIVYQKHVKRMIPPKEEYTTLDNIKGSLVMTLVAFSYAFIFMLQKSFSDAFPKIGNDQINTIRGLMFILVNLFFVMRNKEQVVFDKETNFVLVKRILFSVTGEIIMYASTGYLRIQTVSTFYILYSIVTSFVCAIVYKEPITTVEVIIILLCFLAACLIINPFDTDGRDTPVGILMGIAFVILFCYTVVLIYQLRQKVSIHTSQLYKGSAYFIIASMFGGVKGQSYIWSYEIFFYLVFIGILCSCTNILYNYALNLGKVSYVLPFENLTIVFSLFIGKFALNEDCDFLDYVGTMMILILCFVRSFILIMEEKKDEVLQEIQKAVEIEQSKINEIERAESQNASKSGISNVPKVNNIKENESHCKTYFDLDSQRLSFKE
jgi:drug/metabolite transporter (DMT)-like permease